MRPDTTLVNALNFTEDDLSSNRTGKLTLAQIEALGRYVRRQELGCVIITVFFSVAAFLAVEVNFKNIMAGIAAGLVILILLAALTIYFHRRAARALAQGDVKVATGIASRRIKSSRGKGTMTRYYVNVGDIDFDVEPGIYEAFEEGVTYRVYYVLVLANTIVSAEIV